MIVILTREPRASRTSPKLMIPREEGYQLRIQERNISFYEVEKEAITRRCTRVEIPKATGSLYRRTASVDVKCASGRGFGLLSAKVGRFKETRCNTPLARLTVTLFILSLISLVRARRASSCIEVGRRVGSTAFAVQLRLRGWGSVANAGVTASGSLLSETILFFRIRHTRTQKLKADIAGKNHSQLSTDRTARPAPRGVLRFISVCPSVAAGMTLINRLGMCVPTTPVSSSLF